MTSAPTPRENVGKIPAYVPGKPPTARPGLTSYKLSSNENPYPPLPGVVEAATAVVEQMNRYPDMGASRCTTRWPRASAYPPRTCRRRPARWR